MRRVVVVLALLLVVAVVVIFVVVAVSGMHALSTSITSNDKKHEEAEERVGRERACTHC
jgi:uncharacterized protein YpmB